jgi:aryl-alcohol dehydrogenase-like predicted oxidoreductase
VFGWTLDEERSFAVLDAYVAAGGNFIDTADIYGRHGSGREGDSEAIIGRWMAARGNRDELVIATKVGMSDDSPGLSEAAITKAAAGSLERLGTETIDLYYAHRDDADTPLEETLAAFARLIDDGKIRHAAASNYSGERLREALRIGEREGFARYVALQPLYNLLDREEYEGELQRVCAEEGLACLPFYGLARGFLSGKYREGGVEVDSPRAAGVRASYFNERSFAVLTVLDEVAAAHETSVAAVALAWLAAQPTVLAPIASATSPEQLTDLLASVRAELTDEELEPAPAFSAGREDERLTVGVGDRERIATVARHRRLWPRARERALERVNRGPAGEREANLPQARRAVRCRLGAGTLP